MFEKIKSFLFFKKEYEFSGVSKKILVVDDNEVDLQFAVKVLKKKAYQVFLARTGKEALEEAKKEIPDLILLDCLLPDINGKDICRLLKEEESTKDIPVVFLTVVDSGTNMMECYDSGADIYLTKPISAKHLLFQIKVALEEQQSE